MQKALTTEDLVYILDSIFKLSKEPNNAFQMLEDGLYVKSYEVHEQDTNLHIEERIREILDKITVDNAGNIYYDTYLLSRVSSQPNNAIKQKEDGIFVEDIIQDTKDHMASLDVHVTKEKQETWDKMLDQAKDFTAKQIGNISIYDYTFVNELPEENIVSTTCYFWTKDPEKPDEVDGVPYIYAFDRWCRFSITNATLDKLATKKELEGYLPKMDYQKHENMSALEKFTEDKDGNLLYNGEDIRHIFISDEANNAIELRNGKLYAKDYSQTIHDLQVGAAFSKDVLYNKECAGPGVYELDYSIDDFSMLLIDFYYKPNDPESAPGNAKSVMVDVGTLNDLYGKGIDYMLELGYGVSTSNSKISMNKDKMWVNYYHNVCIYKITGIRKDEGDGNV